MVAVVARLSLLTKLRIHGGQQGSQICPYNRVWSKGKQPRLSSKVPKYPLSGKGRFISNTAGRLAQKQPSFKECVTAHLNTLTSCRCGDSAPKMIGAQTDYRRQRFILHSCKVSGRGAFLLH